MDFDSLMLLLIAWLLWTIHQDLTENNDRVRSLKTTLSQILSGIEQLPDAGSSATASAPAASAEVSTININTASKAKLQTLPRIGAVTAEHIIAARPYGAVDELRRVQGITDAIFREIRARVGV